MKLHEYQSKQLFAEQGIPIPRGRVAATASAAKAITQELGGGRGSRDSDPWDEN